MTFDAAKDAANQAKHGLSLADAARFVAEAVVEDERQDYGERRYRAFGTLDGRYCALAFTVRDGVVRAISLRRARAKEIKRYVP